MITTKRLPIKRNRLTPSFNACHKKGFTLAELLVGLALLGTIGTYTIPKVLITQRYQSANVAAVEIASSITANYHQKVNLEGRLASSITPNQLASNLNVIRFSSSYEDGTLDGGMGYFWSCQSAVSVGQACVVLHNGGCLQILQYGEVGYAGFIFLFDPDNNGPMERVVFYLSANGRLSSGSTKGFLLGWGSSWESDPSWFHWL
jgi:prepilin-type N-terminal cleavage/methylation domain-containing protein